MFPRIQLRIKRRTVAVFLLCLFLISLPVVTLLFLAGAQIGQGDVIRFNLGERSARRVILGDGLNLTSLESGNLIDNGSFEPVVYRKQLVAASGTAQSLLILNNDQESEGPGNIPLDEFFVDARIRVFSRRGGEQTLRKESRVESCRSNQISSFHAYTLPPDTPKGLLWNCLSEGLGDLTAGGQSGYILRNISTNPSFVRLPGEEDVKAMAPLPKGCFILDAANNLYLMDQEGKLKTLPHTAKYPIQGICTRTRDDKTTLLAVAEKGFIWVGSTDSLSLHKLGFDLDFYGCLADDSGFYIYGEEGTLLYSPDAVTWTTLMHDAGSPAWRSLAVRGSVMLLGGDKGRAALSRDHGKSFEVLKRKAFLEAEHKAGLPASQRLQGFVSACLFSDEKLCLIDTAGYVYQSSNEGGTWTLLQEDDKDGLHILKRRSLFETSSGLIVGSDERGGLSYALLGAVIRCDSPLEEGEFKAGDIVQLEKLSPLPRDRMRMLRSHTGPEAAALTIGPQAVYAGEWYTAQGTKALPVSEEPSPGGGLAGLHIYRDNDALPGEQMIGLYSGRLLQDTVTPKGLRISHILSPDAIARMHGQSAFKLEFWAKTADPKSVKAEVSLSGLKLPVDPVSRQIDGEWHKYSLFFIIPSGVAEGDDVRLNFDFETDAGVYLDQIDFRSAETTMDFAGEAERLQELRPNIVRLSFMPVGSRNLPSEYWLSREAGSQTCDFGGLSVTPTYGLNEVARMLERASAAPWICIRPWAGESELRHLMQYLFGSSNSEYGQKRMQQGTAARWTDLFTQIYFEFGEDEGSFVGDQNRSAFVEWAISVMSSTPEYKLVKNQIVFVDGMHYRDGVLLSSADSHAGDYADVQPVANLTELREGAERRFEELPRDAMRASAPRPELIRSFSAGGEALRLSDVFARVFYGLGDRTLLCLINEGRGEGNLPAPMAAAVIRASENLAGLSPVQLTPEDGQIPEDLLAFGFENRRSLKVYLVNIGDEPKLAAINGRDWSNATMTSFDAAGSLLEQRRYGKRAGVISILPGSCIVLSLEVQR